MSLNDRDIYDLIDKLIQDYIEDNALLDIIYEIINTNKAYRDYSLYSPNHRLLVMLSDWIESSLINNACQEVVKETTKYIVNDYLRNRVEEKIVAGTFDPLVLVTNSLTEKTIDMMIEPLAKEVIKEEAEDYMYEANVIGLIRNVFVPIYCEEIISEAGWELGMEQFFEDCLETVIYEHIMDLIVDCVESEKDRLNEIALEEAFGVFLQRAIMKEAVNELEFLIERQNEEEVTRERERVEGHELSTFMMEKPEITKSFENVPIFFNNESMRNGNFSMSQNKTETAGGNMSIGGFGSPGGKGSKGGQSGLGPGKSSILNSPDVPGAARAQRKKQDQSEESQQGPFYRRSGTKTYYNDPQ
ncbi:unnamed protein product [Blepharisma stoltei]|uniref:Uncharacterized protein n=1 Tax=Blepharisma stoltei TaxID=1481888 RepID=A0AAU9IFJ2_9CILI|nr:unnamed protein product [Blepharisma stoltei]